MVVYTNVVDTYPEKIYPVADTWVNEIKAKQEQTT